MSAPQLRISGSGLRVWPHMETPDFHVAPPGENEAAVGDLEAEDWLGEGGESLHLGPCSDIKASNSLVP